ncbi:hypothetical protein G6F56_007644 [Rhizopus delemar]|uniref:Uncharacterized protein n=1 Tax=Rhizopus stolonifer TaxID=4846 RepID=A0A367K2E9_RHIST|nr:hypothetical protein G6F56_007644 [Rhizopus delemar]RCH96325.1 hypothetical protein CU098_008330 [Rhizopus stolonifer]
MSVEERTCLYQQKYTNLIEADNTLRAWIKFNKQKGPPIQLTEDYLSQYPVPSISMSNDVTLPPPKKSFSTFLKKTIRSSNSPLSKQQSKSRSQPTNMSEIFYQDSSPKSSISSLAVTRGLKFSLSSSLNRLSSNKRHDPDPYDFTNKRVASKTSHSPTAEDRLPKLTCQNSDTKMKTMPAIVECPKLNERLIPQKYSKSKNRPQSVFITSSTPSVFLDRLHRQSVYQDREYQAIQSNLRTDTSAPSFQHSQNRTGDKKTLSTNRDLSLPWNSQRRKNTGEQAEIKGSTKKEIESIPDLQNGKYKSASIISEEAKRKKRMSFSLGPSLSTIRFMPQRSHALKRQSMLA